MNMKNLQNATTVLTLVGAALSVAYGVIIVTKEIKTAMLIRKSDKLLNAVNEKIESV